jgi:predicted porin
MTVANYRACISINRVKGNIMTKKLLPTVIGMILAGGVAVAQADVQVMGHIDEALAYINGGEINDGTHQNYYPFVAKGSNNTQLVCTTCSIGFKGEEDLGNGLKALFFLDWQYDINNGSGLDGRDQYVGLGGNFGTLKFGTMSTVYKSYGAMLDPVYRTIAQQRDVGLQSTLHSGKGDTGEGRATQTVGYNSPNWSGLSLAATYTIQPDSTTPRHDNPFSAGINYENGGLLGFVTYVTNMAGHDDAATAVGAKYTLNNFSVFGQYEFDMGLITDSATGTLGQDNSGDGADVWMVGGTYTMGNNTLYAGYGSDKRAKTFDNTQVTNPVPPPATVPVGNVVAGDFNSWELVGLHSFSKRTLAYAGYVGSDPNQNNVDTLGIYTVGMKHTF